MRLGPMTPTARTARPSEWLDTTRLKRCKSGALCSEPITIALWVDDRELKTTTFDAEKSARFEIDRQDFGGQAVEFRVTLPPGDRRIAVAIPRIYEGLPAALNGPNPSTRTLSGISSAASSSSSALAKSTSRKPTTSMNGSRSAATTCDVPIVLTSRRIVHAVRRRRRGPLSQIERPGSPSRTC